MTTQQSLYRTLDKSNRTIRLLQILPAPHPSDGRIQCILHERSLNQDFNYKALSYTWGEPDELNFKIWVTGTWQSTGLLVPVGQNLLCCLRVLRANMWDDKGLSGSQLSNTNDNLLWIDAICINQSDYVERGHQVDMMRDIYRGAEEVFAWLGTPDRDELSDSQLDTETQPPKVIGVPAFKAVTRAMTTSRDNTPDREKSSATFELKRMPIKGMGARNPKAYETKGWLGQFVSRAGQEIVQLAELCQVDYWSRLWILQEVCLARHVMLLYGRCMLDWNLLYEFRLASSREGVPVHPFYQFELQQIAESRPWTICKTIRGAKLDRGESRALKGTLHTSNNTTQLLSLKLKGALEMSKDAHCQDRRDKVYGVLGLADDVGPGDIEVDYSLSLFELYAKVMEFNRRKYSVNGISDKPKHGATTYHTPGVVAFSQLLQNALLGPDLGMEAYEEMANGRRLSGILNHEQSSKFILRGTADGEVVFVLNERDYLKEQPLTSDEKRWRKVVDDFIQSQPTQDILHRTLELDHHSLENLSRAIDDDHKPVYGITWFVVDSNDMGVGSSASYDMGIRFSNNYDVGICSSNAKTGDVLWGNSEGSPWAIVRKVDGVWTIIGRACFLEDLENTPDEFGEFVDVGPGRDWGTKDMSLEVTMGELQALTCPLRYNGRKSNGTGIFPQLW